MTYYIHDDELAYRNWILSCNPDNVLEWKKSIPQFSAKIIMVEGKPEDEDGLPRFALEFPTEAHAILFKVRYS